MKKYYIGGGILLLLILVVVANLLKKDNGIEVTAEKVTRGVVQQKVTGSGQIRPAVQVKVSAQVAGKIVQLNAREGDRVRKGQLLVALDPEKYIASVERAKSSLYAAQANEKKAKSDLERSRELFAKKLISQSEFEGAEANYEAAVSNRMQAEASLKEAEDALNKTRLYATMNGVVTKINKEVGEMALGAQFQEDVIMVVSDLSKMEAIVEVDENDVVDIHPGDSAKVEVDAFPDTVFDGRVTEIANSAITKGLGTQEQVTNFEVTITINNPDPRFRPGMSTTVDILTRRLENVLKVPIQAVTVRERKVLRKTKQVEDTVSDEEASTEEKKMQEVVFVIEDGRAAVRPVKLGISDDTHYAVLSGVSKGEWVITGPFKILNKTLKDGDPVHRKKKSGKQ
ncbi:MAG TPA: efflux RND transporter periplasmic adaptor subunit [Caldithrix abyssi]|uniref:Efflux RND transporter periplasmic adaptor subunit n=1 Tax=Caldithrix abyssi TaxID=187145 RepID=A0A7V5PNP8_CALAY|nr:efflux RND transporter periplasmic adaptor subunit [Caldithrix abyssi]